MILRNVTARHSRRHLAPIARASLRQLTTAVENPTTRDGPPTLNAEEIEETSRKTGKRGGVRTLSAESSLEHAGRSWATTRSMTEGGPVLTPAQQFAEFQRLQLNTKKLGSNVRKRYVPKDLIHDPPGPEDVTLELLMASQTHLGHNTSLWNPANSRYIYGARHGVHIISLETTAAHLRRAARVVEEVSYNGGLILYVGTRKNQMEVVARAASMARACHLFTRWTPGTITNRDKILAMKPTKMINQNDEILEDFGKYTSASRPLVPDLVVCLNPLENYTMLYECGLASVPTIGIIDTDADPSWVTYTIPANDDSLRSVALIGGVLGRAGQQGRRRRLADAAKGKVTWSTSDDVKVYMRQEMTDVILRRKQVMGRMQEKLLDFTEEESALLNSRLPSEPATVGHDEMLGLMSEATQGQVEDASKVAEESVAEVEVTLDAQDEASMIVDEVEAHVNEASAKTQEMVAKFMAAKGKSQGPSTTLTE